jgi:hypothetical protein
MEDNIEHQSWRTSTYTGNGGGNCVEVGHAANAVIVRDTKNRGGLVLNVPAHAWAKFTASLR